MTYSNTTYYCAACEKERATRTRYSHEKTKIHKRNVKTKSPLPSRDIPPDKIELISTETFQRLDSETEQQER